MFLLGKIKESKLEQKWFLKKKKKKEKWREKNLSQDKADMEVISRRFSPLEDS